MYSKDEKRKLRGDYWSQFKSFSNKKKLKAGKPGKWMMENTGIKQIRLKFHFDEHYAWAGIIVDTKNLDIRIDLYDKFEKLKSIIESKVPHELIWELEKEVNETKTISCIYAQLNNVSIYKQDCWKEVNKFLYETMAPIEDVISEFFDFIKYQD